jgi:hypothetical protein
MSPIDLTILREKRPDLQKVWDCLAKMNEQVRRMPFLDPRRLRCPEVPANQLAQALYALAATGRYRAVFKVEDPFTHRLLSADFDSFSQVPDDLATEEDQHFHRDQAEIVTVLREVHGA